MAELATANLVTVGASLSHVHVPGHDESHDNLGVDEVEIGMGIHNEQGFKRMKVPDTPELINALLRQLLDEGDADRAFLGPIKKGDEFALMINNLGGVSPLELGGVTTEIVNQLDCNYSINLRRVYSGTFMSSLNGNGISISLLRLADGRMLQYLDMETGTLGWPRSMNLQNQHQDVQFTPGDAELKTDKESSSTEYTKSGLMSKDVHNQQ